MSFFGTITKHWFRLSKFVIKIVLNRNPKQKQWLPAMQALVEVDGVLPGNHFLFSSFGFVRHFQLLFSLKLTLPCKQWTEIRASISLNPKQQPQWRKKRRAEQLTRVSKETARDRAVKQRKCCFVGCTL